MPFVDDLDEKPELELGSKTEPSTPTSCNQSFFEKLEEPGEDNIIVSFDLKPVYLKVQTRANGLSRQRVENGKVKIRVITLGPQLVTIEAYVERTPDAAMLVGDKCGRVRLKPQPGKYYPHQVTRAVLRFYVASSVTAYNKGRPCSRRHRITFQIFHTTIIFSPSPFCANEGKIFLLASYLFFSPGCRSGASRNWLEPGGEQKTGKAGGRNL